jgi:hypothetical protein
MSMAIDRHLYTRVLLQALMYGEKNCRLDEDWRQYLTFDVFMVTGAKSHDDHPLTFYMGKGMMAY